MWFIAYMEEVAECHIEVIDYCRKTLAITSSLYSKESANHCALALSQQCDRCISHAGIQ